MKSDRPATFGPQDKVLTAKIQCRQACANSEAVRREKVEKEIAESATVVTSEDVYSNSWIATASSTLSVLHGVTMQQPLVLWSVLHEVTTQQPLVLCQYSTKSQSHCLDWNNCLQAL